MQRLKEKIHGHEVQNVEWQRKYESMKTTLVDRELRLSELENKIAKLTDDVFNKDCIFLLLFL